MRWITVSLALVGACTLIGRLIDWLWERGWHKRPIGQSDEILRLRKP